MAMIGQTPLTAAIEAGGTKFVCALGTGPDDLRAVTRIPTTTPDETLAQVVDFFSKASAEHGAIDRIGVATFGPAGVVPGRSDYGFITTTPKPHWGHTDVLGRLKAHWDVPAGFDTDVNGAALAEGHWGAGVGKDSVLYLTIGTGIGGGLCLHGAPLRGLGHPEMGHIFVARSAEDIQAWKGACPYHGPCLEGLISGPAIAKRWGQSAETLPDSHEAWAWAADILAPALATFHVTLSPQIIIIGGGVGVRPSLLEMTKQRLNSLMNGYVTLPEICAPALGDRSGVLGAIALGQAAT